MKLSTRLASVGATAVLLAGLAACSATPADTADEGTFASGDSNVLVFATLPDHEGADQDAQPIADWIAEFTGKEVEFFPATDYTAVVQGLASGQIDIAQISAFTYYQSQAAGADIEPIGAQITKEGAEPGYYSVAIANPAWDGSTIEDFADEPVCFVNPTSTSGRAIPASQLKAAGVTVAEENVLAPEGGSHDLNAAKVAEGTECQVGFAQDIDADPLIDSGALVEVDRYLVPAAPIVMQAGLPQELKDLLIAEIADSTQSSLTDAGIELNEFLTDGWFGFGRVDDAYYDSIRTVCEEIADEVEACQA
ncbi:PhnD/SsuA/transferrin family substrate-binding protein [Pseudolysinimonas sp.]|jgi:phosphonate transport system substrate-binding protein|uniref:PhnD/SsuA/transferrin family substrate-binding protein n=1 Tax=Pseudolysinimonas sp. TaxID=2680009 RepID=UPI003783B569